MKHLVLSKLLVRSKILIIVVIGFSLSMSCSESPVNNDSTPPGTVSNLVVIDREPNALLLRWIATGDDGDSGRAASYLIKEQAYSPYTGWEYAHKIPCELNPSISGVADSFWVTDLPSNSFRQLWVAAVDEQGNISDTSNVLAVRTEPLLDWVDEIATPDSIGKMASGDLNGDGFPDLVTIDRLIQIKLRVYLNDTHGKFPTISGEYSGISIVWGIKLADMDLDQDLDIIIDNRGAVEFIILFNDGLGGFDSSVTIPRPGAPNSFTVGDINGDSLPDIIATDLNNDSLIVFINLGDGQFDSMYRLNMGERSYDVNLADLNGDGQNDLLVNLATGTKIYLGNNSSQFEYHVDLYANDNSIIYDMDMDGDLDILFGGGILYYNDGGEFIRSVSTNVLEAKKHRVAVGDIDGDGFVDVLRSGNGSSCLYFGQSKIEGFFYREARYGPYVRSEALVVDDFDGDGRRDDVAVATNDSRILFFTGMQ